MNKIHRNIFILGLTANRNPCYGSWLFRALTEVFMVHAHNKDLVEMKDLVSTKSEFSLRYFWKEISIILCPYVCTKPILKYLLFAFFSFKINQQFDVLYEDTLRQQTCSLYEHGVGKKLYFNPGLYERRDN